MKKKIIISVIIPCFNGEKYLADCLKSLLASNFAGFEIIVVDDGSTDGSAELIKPPIRNQVAIKLIENRQNLGPAKSRNMGAKITSGKYLLFLDVDTKIHPQCLAEIVEKFEKNPQIGAIQARLDTGGHFLTPFGFPYEIPAGKKEKLIFGARTAGMAIRKDLFEKIGGFDGDYFIYGEDTDLSWRVWLVGKKICYLPQAKIHHFSKSSLTNETSNRIFYEGTKNNFQNILKNAPWKILIWMLPLHAFAWLIITFKLLFQGRFSQTFWIYRGLFWNLAHLKKILKKRREVDQITVQNSQLPLFGKIKLAQLLVKGLIWWKNV